LGDLGALRWSNIDLDRGEIRFVTAKTGRRMIIPLSEGLRSHIASLPSSDRADAVPAHGWQCRLDEGSRLV
jgi:integrase